MDSSPGESTKSGVAGGVACRMRWHDIYWRVLNRPRKKRREQDGIDEQRFCWRSGILLLALEVCGVLRDGDWLLLLNSSTDGKRYALTNALALYGNSSTMRRSTRLLEGADGIARVIDRDLGDILSPLFALLESPKRLFFCAISDNILVPPGIRCRQPVDHIKLIFAGRSTSTRVVVLILPTIFPHQQRMACAGIASGLFCEYPVLFAVSDANIPPAALSGGIIWRCINKKD